MNLKERQRDRERQRGKGDGKKKMRLDGYQQAYLAMQNASLPTHPSTKSPVRPAMTYTRPLIDSPLQSLHMLPSAQHHNYTPNSS